MRLLFLFTLLYTCSLSIPKFDYNPEDPNLGQFITKPGKSQASVYDDIYPWLIKHPSGN